MSSKIIGGTYAEQENFKFIVSLKYFDGSHFCGGSLISLIHILTAAHCFEDLETHGGFFVAAGTIDLTRNAITCAVEKYEICRDYDFTFRANSYCDVAVITVSCYVLLK